MILGGVLIGSLAGLVLAEAFFAKGDNRTPALVLAATFTLGIVAKVTGFMSAGIDGLAGATTVYFAIYPVILFWLLERDLARLRAGVCVCVMGQAGAVKPTQQAEGLL